MTSHKRIRAGLSWQFGEVAIILGMLVGAVLLVLYGTGHIL